MEFSHAPLMLSEICDYSVILILLIALLILAVVWNLWKNGKRYANLPSYYSVGFEVVYEYLTNKTKSLPFNAVLFRKMDAVCKQFEKEGMVHTWCFRHIVGVFSDEAAKIFATNEASAEKSADYEIMKEIMGEGLITSQVETWKKDRKLLDPVFHLVNLKAHMPILNENAKILVTKLSKVADKPNADFLPFLEHCAFHNICESIFDVNMKDNMSEMEIEKSFELIARMKSYITSRWFLPPMIAKLHRFCTPSGWNIKKIYQEGHQLGLKVISSAMESISQKSCDPKKDLGLNQKSIMYILLQHQMKNPLIPPSYLKDHVHTFLGAGIETVNYTMMWCLYLLGLNKDVQQEAYDAIQSVADEFVTYENLCQMEYLECILKETLRLYPTVPVLARHLKKDLMCGKYTVPKDTTIFIFLYRLHRNPEIYPDPEKFDPDRFCSSNIGKLKWAHLPFSEGYRHCIGKKLAMMEMKVMLAYILRNYEITSFDRREDIDLNWDISLMPTRPLRMGITRR